MCCLITFKIYRMILYYIWYSIPTFLGENCNFNPQFSHFLMDVDFEIYTTIFSLQLFKVLLTWKCITGLLSSLIITFYITFIYFFYICFHFLFYFVFISFFINGQHYGGSTQPRHHFIKKCSNLVYLAKMFYFLLNVHIEVYKYWP